MGLEDKTLGELVFMEPYQYENIKAWGDDVKQRRVHYNEVLVWDTGYSAIRTYDKIHMFKMVGPECAVKVIFAVYQDAVAANVHLTLVESKQDLCPNESGKVVEADVCGKVTARNSMLTVPEAFSTLFARTCDYANVKLGALIPLSKPSVVVPAKSSLLLDFNLEFRVPSKHSCYYNTLKTESSLQVPASQPFESFIDMISPDVDGAVATIKVEVKWLKFNP
jgi:hypothetical protein